MHIRIDSPQKEQLGTHPHSPDPLLRLMSYTQKERMNELLLGPRQSRPRNARLSAMLTYITENADREYFHPPRARVRTDLLHAPA